MYSFATVQLHATAAMTCTLHSIFRKPSCFIDIMAAFLLIWSYHSLRLWKIAGLQVGWRQRKFRVWWHLPRERDCPRVSTNVTAFVRQLIGQRSAWIRNSWFRLPHYPKASWRCIRFSVACSRRPRKCSKHKTLRTLKLGNWRLSIMQKLEMTWEPKSSTTDLIHQIVHESWQPEFHHSNLSASTLHSIWRKLLEALLGCYCVS